MTDRRRLPFLLGLALAAMLGFGSTLKPPHAESGDAPDYLNAAYHLRHHLTFAESWDSGPVAPAVGREPGYAVLLAGLMLVDRGLGAFTPACLQSGQPCPPEVSYRAAQWANPALAAAAALALQGATRLLGGTPLAATAAALLVLGNVEMMKSRHYVLSDYLALFLVALTMLALAWALAAPARPRRWASAGLALAALTLTKAVFLPLAGLGLLGAALRLAGRLAGGRRGGAGALLAFALAFALPVGGWMARNAAVGGEFALTQARSGIALSTREVFNHLSLEQYLCAWVYWTRGFGDGMARHRFPPEVWQPFEIDRPGGFYDLGQNRYLPRVAELAASRNLEPRAARAAADRELVDAILERPLAHLAATLPVFWRGLWIDEFIVFTLPALVWATVRGVRRRQAGLLALLGLGWFNLLAYALASLNIPRYQITALPALALAGGLAVQALAARLRTTLRPAASPESPRPGTA
jgi:4-amino-4-deoxy-L-arabinose transferase-like glycosyltransferase